MEFNDIDTINYSIANESFFKLDLLNGAITLHESNNKIGDGSGIVILSNGEKYHFYSFNQKIIFLTSDEVTTKILLNNLEQRIKKLLELTKQRDDLFNTFFGL